MRFSLRLSLAAFTLCASAMLLAGQDSQTPPEGGSSEPTLRVTSSLVFLDVTVVDKDGKPVAKGLEQKDFTITEDGKPQRMFSFESADTHVMAANAKDDDPDGKAPVAIFVLDRLNCTFDDFERDRQHLIAYLKTQPENFDSPAEVLLLNNNSLEMLQGYTRSRADLLWAVEHIEPAVPFKAVRHDFDFERASDSLSAVLEISVQNLGVPGRKNIFWIGPGGPNLSRASYGPALDGYDRLFRAAVDMLVDSRISLFVVFPALKVEAASLVQGSIDSNGRSHNLGNNSRKTGDVNFALFARQTGGALFYNRNDIDAEIARSRDLGAHYYTLTYQPTDHTFDGKYRTIRVTLRDPGLHAITKDGYFAIDRNAPVDLQQKTLSTITHVAQSTIPFSSLSITVSDVVRRPESHSAQFTVHIKPKNLGWIATADGKKAANLLMGVTTLSGSKKILAWKFEKVNLQSTAADPDNVSGELRVRLTATVPSKAQAVRVVLETADAGRIGTVDIDRKTLEAAPVAAAAAKAGS